jgi:hypothetical protein
MKMPFSTAAENVFFSLHSWPQCSPSLSFLPYSSTHTLYSPPTPAMQTSERYCLHFVHTIVLVKIFPQILAKILQFCISCPLLSLFGPVYLLYLSQLPRMLCSVALTSSHLHPFRLPTSTPSHRLKAHSFVALEVQSRWPLVLPQTSLLQ